MPTLGRKKLSSLRADIVLIEQGLARSRGHAADLIKAGRVFLADKKLLKPSQPVAQGSQLTVLEHEEYVSRAGLKLHHALERFPLDLVGATALDVGASTGGFTEVLLRKGAKLVVAIDVGHDQLASSLRENPRVISLEGVNAREVTLAGLREATGVAGLAFDVVVADLSFISLTLVLEALVKTAPNAEFMLLIKPQFEVGKQSLSASGVVSDHRLRARAITQVVEAAAELGFGVRDLARSELPGTHGNIEYLLWISSSEPVNRSIWTERIEALARESK